MTAIGPYTKAYDMTHMYSFVDYRGKPYQTCIPNNTLTDLINTHPKLSKFKRIFAKTNLDAQLSEPEANFTILAPSDDHLTMPANFYSNMDDGLARQMVKMSMMNGKLDSSVLKASPVSYFYTRNRERRLYTTNINGVTTFNQCASIIQYDLHASNGILHLTDGLLFPTNQTYM